jgi:Glycosyl hydrolase family 26
MKRGLYRRWESLVVAIVLASCSASNDSKSPGQADASCSDCQPTGSDAGSGSGATTHPGSGTGSRGQKGSGSGTGPGSATGSGGGSDAGPTTHDASGAGDATSDGTAPVDSGTGAAPDGGSDLEIGVFTGGCSTPGPFATQTGVPMHFASTYLDSDGSWADLDSSVSWCSAQAGYREVIALPILPGIGDYATAATGAYNSYFVTLAQNLVNNGMGNAILRLGWEWDGTWFYWKVSSLADAQNMAKFDQNIVTSMRSVTGQSFGFEWDYASNSSDGYTADDAYPGDAYIDYIGLDFYDQTWTGSCGLAYTAQVSFDATQANCVWNNDYLPNTLTPLATFAAAHDKPMAFGEWGPITRTDYHGGNDDPTFMDNFTGWLKTHDVAWADYFSCCGTGSLASDGYDSQLSDFPNSAARFTADLAGY